MDVDQLRDEFERILEEQLQEQRESSAGRGSASQTLEDLRARGREVVLEIRRQLLAELQGLVERELGPIQGIQFDSVLLDALDERGRLVKVPVMVETRRLRYLPEPANASKTEAILGSESLALALYDGVPSTIAPAESEDFRRIYTGDAASAIGMEAKLLVTLKGGEWLEPEREGRVANAVAVRGLDLTRGLVSNSNKTYDDTMYVVLEEPGGEAEVYEYRMTTESSSSEPGVGRLSSKQVTYVRGLHRGKDPAYRLKGNYAEGTRRGQKGTHRIVGANMHSAYSRRPINSETPLSPKVSLGCQVVAAGKRAFERSLVSFLDSKGIKQFPYTIVDGEELALLDRALIEKRRESVLVRRVPREQAHQASGTQVE